MEILKCSNCGAKLNKRTYYCDYCGTQYTKAVDGTAIPPTNVNGRSRTQKDFIIPKLSREQLVVTMEHLQQGAAVIILPVVFMIVWCSIALGAGISVLLTAGSFAAIVPFFMAGFGIFALIHLIRSYFKDSVKPIIRKFENGQDQEAYDLAKKKGLKNQDALLIALLLAYHVFGDEAYLEQNAIRVTNSKISSTSNYTNDFCVLVEKYTTIKE